MKRADERAIGRVYACNTLGAIAGVLLAVHVLLPGVGVKGAVLAGALLQLAIALLFVPRPFGRDAPRAARAVLAGSAALVLLVGLFLQLDPMRMASGVYRKGMARLPEDVRVTLLKDGKTATISLAQQGDVVTIATNGKPDASINMGGGEPTPDEITMTMAAALPLAIHAAPRDVANIGIGSGLTSQVVLASPVVRRLDSIEIEPAMAAAAREGFGARVERLYEDPRSEIHFEDAKTFFAAARRSYDVIISEPSNPWISGVATLFSEEFYAQIKRHLKPDGLLVQWIQIYETDLSVVASIFKALSPHFADYAVYSTDDANILIVAVASGPVPGLVNDPFATPALADELRRAGLENLGDIAIRRIGGKRLLDGLFATFDAPANSDFRPFVDLNAPRMRFLSRDALDLVRLQLLPVPVTEILGEPLAHSPSASPASARYFTRHRLAIDAGRLLEAWQAGDAALAPEEARAVLSAVLGSACATPEERGTWLQAVHGLAAATTPFLIPAQRTPAWRELERSGCVAQLDPADRQWFELLHASATGSAHDIATRALQVLQTPPSSLSGAQMVEALLVAACALDATGRSTEARQLLESYLPALQNAGQYALALRLAFGKVLLSHAAAHPDAAGPAASP
jgi:SAM-dependent methyltransferase